MKNSCPKLGAKAINSGSKSNCCKLTADQVKVIRSQYIKNVTGMKCFAVEYGVSEKTIWNLIKRVNWKHVQG